MADITGSSGYERMTGNQIAKVYQTNRDAYLNTEVLVKEVQSGIDGYLLSNWGHGLKWFSFLLLFVVFSFFNICCFFCFFSGGMGVGFVSNLFLIWLGLWFTYTLKLNLYQYSNIDHWLKRWLFKNGEFEYPVSNLFDHTVLKWPILNKITTSTTIMAISRNRTFDAKLNITTIQYNTIAHLWI